MYIKIYTKSQLILLKQINVLFKKRKKIPDVVLKEAEVILENRPLGKAGFIAIFPDVLWDDIKEIKEKLNCYPRRLEIRNDLESISVSGQDGKEWYLDTIKIQGERSWIYAIYSMTIENIYGY